MELLDAETTCSAKVRLLLTMLPKKGPDAFPRLLDALRETSQKSIVHALETMVRSLEAGESSECSK